MFDFQDRFSLKIFVIFLSQLFDSHFLHSLSDSFHSLNCSYFSQSFCLNNFSCEVCTTPLYRSVSRGLTWRSFQFYLFNFYCSSIFYFLFLCNWDFFPSLRLFSLFIRRLFTGCLAYLGWERTYVNIEIWIFRIRFLSSFSLFIFYNFLYCSIIYFYFSRIYSLFRDLRILIRLIIRVVNSNHLPSSLMSSRLAMRVFSLLKASHWFCFPLILLSI